MNVPDDTVRIALVQPSHCISVCSATVSLNRTAVTVVKI